MYQLLKTSLTLVSTITLVVVPVISGGESFGFNESPESSENYKTTKILQLFSPESHTENHIEVPVTQKSTLISQGTPNNTKKIKLPKEVAWEYKPIFSIGENYIAGVGPNNNINIWDLNGKYDLISTLPSSSVHNNGIHSIAISDDDQYIVSSGDSNEKNGKNLVIWDTRNNSRRLIVKDINSRISSLDFYENNQGQRKLVVALLNENTENIIILDFDEILSQHKSDQEVSWSKLKKEEEFFYDEDDNTAVTSLSVSPRGKWLAASGSSGMLVFWDTSSWFRQSIPLLENTPTKGATQLAFAEKDGSTYVAAAIPHEGIRVWKFIDGKPQVLNSELLTLEGSPRSVAFNSDANKLIAGDDKGKIKVWNLEDYETAVYDFNVKDVEDFPVVGTVGFNPISEKELITASSNGIFTVIQKPPVEKPDGGSESDAKPAIGKILLGSLILIYCLFALVLLYLWKQRFIELTKHILKSVKTLISDGKIIAEPVNSSAELIGKCGDNLSKIADMLSLPELKEICIDYIEEGQLHKKYHRSEVDSDIKFDLDNLIENVRDTSKKIKLIEDQNLIFAKKVDLTFSNFKDKLPEEVSVLKVANTISFILILLHFILGTLGIWFIVSGLSETENTTFYKISSEKVAIKTMF